MASTRVVERGARACALLVAACGALALGVHAAGHAPLLALGLPGAPLIKPGTAAGYTLAGLAVAAMGTAAPLRRGAALAGAALALLALLALSSLGLALAGPQQAGSAAVAPPVLSLLYLLVAFAAWRFDPAARRGQAATVVAFVVGAAVSVGVLAFYADWWLHAGRRLLLLTVAPQSAVLQMALSLAMAGLCRAARPGPYSRRQVSLFTIAASMLLALAGAWGLILAANSASVLRDVGQRTEGVAQTLLEHMHRSLDPADVVLRHVAQRVGRDGLAHLAQSREEWEELSATVASLQQLDAVVVLDAEGRVVSYSAQFPPALARTFAHRDYFVAHRQGQRVVLGPLIQAASGKAAFTYSRRLDERDGRFAGVVVATLELDYFRAFYGSLNLGPDGAVGLFRTDQRSLLHEPLPLNLDAIDMSRYAPFHGPAPARGDGTFTGVSPFDHVERFVAYRASTALPLIVTASMSAAPLAEAFAQEFLASAMLLALAVVALVNGTAYQFRAIDRDGEHQRELEAHVEGLRRTERALLGTQAALRTAHDALEARVAERTASLQDALQRLEESEAQFRNTFEQAAVGIAHVGLDGRWLKVNRRLCEIVGHPWERLQRQRFADITHPEDLQADLALVDELLRGQRESYSMHKRYRREDGACVWAQLTVSLHRGDQGQPLHFISVIEDIQALKDAERALLQANQELERRVAARTRELQASERHLRESALRYQTLIEGSLQGILVQQVQRNFKVLFANEVAARMYGYDGAAALMDEPSLRHLLPESVQDEAEQSWQRLCRGETESIHARRAAVRRDGTPFWIEMLGRRIDWQGEPALQLTIMDVTERERLEAELKRQATIDGLTGLLTRRQFNVLAEQALRQWQRAPQSLTTLMLDIDHFKRVNDTHGHQAGDAVIALVAQTLRAVLRGADLVARYGGEEFVALLVGADEAEALDVAARLRGTLAAQCVLHKGREIRVTASIGISAWQPGEPGVEPALGRADEALYAAKEAGRDRARVHGAQPAAAPAPLPG